jgi:hypothetical protein
VAKRDSSPAVLNRNPAAHCAVFSVYGRTTAGGVPGAPSCPCAKSPVIASSGRKVERAIPAGRSTSRSTSAAKRPVPARSATYPAMA